MTAAADLPIPTGSPQRGRHGAVARNSVLSMAALIVLGGTRVLYGSMISRATDPETYGLVGVLTAVTMILSLVLPAGVAAAISRFVPHARGRREIEGASGLYRALSRIGLAGAAALGLAAAAGAAYFELGASQVLQVGILTAVYCLYLTHRAGLYGFDRVSRYAGLEVLGSAAIVMTTIVILAVGSTWYLTPLIAGYGAFVVGAHLSLRGYTRPATTPMTRSQVREIALYVALACIGTLASAGFLYGTQLLAAQYARLTEVAYFTATITLISPLWLLPRALGLALFPFMAEAHGAGELDIVRRHADLATRTLLGLLGPVFVAGILLARELLVLYGGPQFADGAPVMQIILAAAYLGIIQVPSVNALSSASGQQLRTPVGWAVTGAASGLVLLALIGGPLGATGIAIAYLVGTAITAAGPIAVVWRRYGMPWTGPIGRAVVTVGLAFAAARLIDSSLAAGDRSLLTDGTVALIGVGMAVLLLFGDIRGALSLARRGGDRARDEGSEIMLTANPIVPFVEPTARKRL